MLLFFNCNQKFVVKNVERYYWHSRFILISFSFESVLAISLITYPLRKFIRNFIQVKIGHKVMVVTCPLKAGARRHGFGGFVRTHRFSSMKGFQNPPIFEEIQQKITVLQ